MSKNTYPYLLDTASIVITANSHTPLLLGPSNLVANGIVPDDWETTNTMMSIDESHIHYSNGIRLTMDFSKFQIAEPCKESFQDRYLIHKIADTFLEKNPHAPYQGLGLNYGLAFVQDNPRQWLLDRFTPPYLRSKNKIDVFAMLPRIFFDMGSTLRSICKIEINAGNIKKAGEELESDAIVIFIHIDHTAPLNADEIRAAIGLWKEKQDFVISALDAIFGDIDDGTGS